jgi:signal transduction histidine kinase
MKTEGKIRVLLLANEFNSAQIVLEESHFGTGMDIVQTRSRKDFLRRMEDYAPDVLVVEPTGITDLSFGEIVEAAAFNDLPVIALGRDGDDGWDAVRDMDEGAADYIPVSHLRRLPLVVRRVLRERALMAKQEQLQAELSQAHAMLLDNQKLMSIGRLAGSIAHEINNPLESVTNLLYLLRTDPGISEAGIDYVAAAEHEMERVAQISKQTLNFYRETLNPVRLQPADLLDEVLVLYKRRLEERRIEVVRQYRSDTSLLVFPGEMRQVLSNLVTNAIEASAVGGRLTLRVHRSRKWSDEGIHGVRIVVADNGCGIAAQTRQHLGQLFYTTKGQRGTGLGLWVTRAIIKRYGGEIQLYSSTHENRHGTVFSIFMPTNMRPLPVALEGDPADTPDLRYMGRRTVGGDRTPHGGGDGESASGTRGSAVRSFRRKSVPRAAS